MHFHRITRKRAEVPIVPMIDILFILLVYLGRHHRGQETAEILRIELPTVREIPSDTVTDARSVIAVDALGNITLDSLAVPEGLLESYLAAYQKQNPGRKLELEADRKAPARTPAPGLGRPHQGRHRNQGRPRPNQGPGQGEEMTHAGHSGFCEVSILNHPRSCSEPSRASSWTR
jgi:biopolymer transport protein ExbD